MHRTLVTEFRMILAGGFMLRILYFLATPYRLRAHDTDGHIDYINFVAKNWSIPVASHGWEFHQGPLYYFLCAIIQTTAEFAGYGTAIALQFLQGFSAVLACVTLVVAAWCGSVVFGKYSRSALLFAAIIAVFPRLMMFSSQISNDGLFQLTSFIFLGCLLVWWKTGSARWLLLTAATIGVGILTKASSYLFLPILLVCVLFRPKTTHMQKFHWLWSAGLLVAVLAGWLTVLRYVQNDLDRLFTYDSGGMNAQLAVPTSLWSFLWFDPVSILKRPFVDPWTDGTGRQFFWIYFFKSSLFGEFSFQGYRGLLPMARLLSLLLMGSVLVSVRGFFRSLKNKDTYLLPLAVTFIVILEGALLYRALHPFSSNQDFRFSILILPVLAIWAIRGSDGNTRIDRLLRWWLIAFCAVAFAFFLIVGMH